MHGDDIFKRKKTHFKTVLRKHLGFSLTVIPSILFFYNVLTDKRDYNVIFYND